MGFHEFSSPYDWSRIASFKRTAKAAFGGMVDLSVGSPVDPVPDSVRKALGAASNDPNAYGYPVTAGTADLRSAIADLARPKADATWVHASWGVAALLALLFLVSLFGSFLPYLTDQVVMRRIPSARYSVVQSINPAMATFIALAFGEVPTLGECAGIALVIVAVIVTFSGDENPA